MKIDFENKTVIKTVDNIFLILFLIPLAVSVLSSFAALVLLISARIFFLSGTSDVISYSFGFKENFKWQI